MATGDETYERATGVTNGVNTTFSVSTAYETGSVRLWVNGILIRPADDDGFDEVPPTGIETREPPRSSDILTVRYLEA